MSIKRILDYSMPNLTQLPPNKLNWEIEPDKSVLLIHDMQRYFIDFYEENSTVISTLINNIVQLRQWAKSKNIPVIYTAQPYEQNNNDRGLLNDLWGKGLTASTPDKQKIVDKLIPDTDDIVLTKWRYSAFKRSNLLDLMKNQHRNQIIIAGVYAHIGCMMTAVDAFMQDIQPFLVADAIADFSENDHLYALKYISNNAGIVIDLKSIISQKEKQHPNVTKEWLESRVKDLLGEDIEIDNDENLIIYGLDSLKIMQLSSELKNMNINIGFEKLGRNPTIKEWWSLINNNK